MFHASTTLCGSFSLQQADILLSQTNNLSQNVLRYSPYGRRIALNEGGKEDILLSCNTFAPSALRAPFGITVRTVLAHNSPLSVLIGNFFSGLNLYPSWLYFYFKGFVALFHSFILIKPDIVHPFAFPFT